MTRRRARLRHTCVWHPRWEGGIEKWTKNFIRENIWRCDKLHEFEDLLQDSHELFLRLAQFYPRVVEPANFMALYKTSMTNKMHDRSLYMSRKREVHAETTQDVSEIYTEHVGEMTNFGYLQAALNEAPDELRAAMRIIESQPEAFRTAKGRGRGSQNLNATLRRILGFDRMRLLCHRQFDFEGAIKALLTQE